MSDGRRLRERIRKCEDKKITIEQLSRDVFHAAADIREGARSSERQALVRISNQLRALAERGIYDDVQDEVRALVDELYDTLSEL